MAVISYIGVASGRFILDIDDRRHTAVAFIGEDVRAKFFQDRDPIGKTIKLDGVPFEVIGTAAKRGSVFGFSRDNFVMIPIGTYFKTFGAHADLSFSGLALDRDRLNDAQDEVRVLMRSSPPAAPEPGG